MVAFPVIDDAAPLALRTVGTFIAAIKCRHHAESTPDQAYIFDLATGRIALRYRGDGKKGW